MKEQWEQLIEQLNDVDRSLEVFLENGMLSSQSVGKAKPFIKAFNVLKKKIVEFDGFIAPVEPLDLKVSFESTELRELWQRWKDYLAEQHGQMMRTRSEKSAMELLNEMSGGDEAKAVRYLRYAMANRYRSFFQISDKETKEPAKGDVGSGSAFDN